MEMRAERKEERKQRLTSCNTEEGDEMRWRRRRRGGGNQGTIHVRL